jgi:uncharacterized damage-inducible protein DinB
MLDELRTLFAYNRWANLRMLDAVAPLTDAELGRDLGGSLVAMLRQLGRTPPSTDLVRFYREQRSAV